MPKYELMYIVASTISDDQIPTVTDGVLKFIADNDGTVIKEELMGKKKLAYPIKKTRNGFYAGVTFEIPAQKVSDLDTKVRTAPGIIRHLIIGIDEDLERMAKDVIAQEAMNKNRNERAKTAAPTEGESEATPVTDENIDQKIEDALSEDLKNV
ncbi:MAG: rpsF [Candidatus Doudnabacteria bacterium]|nr:rpsF [Candidatus Doudnabacteria bacterium]